MDARLRTSTKFRRVDPVQMTSEDPPCDIMTLSYESARGAAAVVRPLL